MKITKKTAVPKKLAISDLKPGDLFRLAHGEVVWMKTNKTGYPFVEVVDISDGSWGSCCASEPVVPLTGTLEVTE